MKFEKLLINHDNARQVLESRKILDSMGYEIYRDNRDDCDLFIHTYGDGDYQVLNYDDHHNGAKLLNFNEFMEKYGQQEMIELINKAKIELKMNDSDLSLALGRSRQYIGKMLRLPQTDKVKARVIKEINDLMVREKFKPLSLSEKIDSSDCGYFPKGIEIAAEEGKNHKDSKIIGEIKVKIDVDCDEIQEVLIDANNQIDDLKSKLSDSKIEIVNKANKIKEFKASISFLNGEIEKLKFDNAKQVTDLKKTNENQKAVIDRLDDRLIAAEKIHNQDVKLIDDNCRVIDGLERENKLLSKDIQNRIYANSSLRYELKELKSSHTTSTSLNWFLIVSIILAALWCWYV